MNSNCVPLAVYSVKAAVTSRHQNGGDLRTGAR